MHMDQEQTEEMDYKVQLQHLLYIMQLVEVQEEIPMVQDYLVQEVLEMEEFILVHHPL